MVHSGPHNCVIQYDAISRSSEVISIPMQYSIRFTI